MGKIGCLNSTRAIKEGKTIALFSVNTRCKGARTVYTLQAGYGDLKYAVPIGRSINNEL